jgi:hypothetical protein
MEHIVSQRPDVNPVSRVITGRYLAHAKHTHSEWAFIGADLVTGRRHLVNPTIIQAAFLAHGVNRSAVQLALQRLDERLAIEAHVISLVPRKPVKMLPAPVSVQTKLADIVAELGGVDATIDVLVALDRATAA